MLTLRLSPLNIPLSKPRARALVPKMCRLAYSRDLSTAAEASFTESAATSASSHVRFLACSGAALILIFAAPDLALASEGANGAFTMEQAMSKDFELPPDVARLISPSEANSLMTKSGVQYLDVRTPEEFVHGHPPGATNIPFMLRGKEGLIPNPDFTSTLEKLLPNRMAPVVVGCQSGARSTPATVMMMHNGYSNMRNLEGGFPAWEKAGLPSVAEIVEVEEE